MNSKFSQKAWMAVAIWLGLTAATAYSSNAMINIYLSLIQTYFNNLTDVSELFSNYGVLFTIILSIVLIFLIVSAWLGVVAFTFEIGDLVFGNKKEDDEEDEDELAEEITNTVGQVARYLGFSWGLFFILFLILPAVVL